ncbi:MAG TPA: tripartite tricarboxylate transporter substrate binding protein [Corynebacteriales bacterium]|nr:tripartite tricarboxylate transporter substrate binding protein [Mycobacteriales bacterium]
MLFRRNTRLIASLILVLIALIWTVPALAGPGPDGYPTKPITLIVPWGAGGGADTAARAVAAVASKHLGQPLVVVLKPGAAGTTGHIEFLKEKPDGYNLIITTNSPIITVPQFQEVPYDPINDFKFIARVTNLRNVLAVRATADYKTADEFFEYARANPGTITIGHSGAMGIGHMSIKLMELELGTTFIDIPFTTAGEAIIAAAGGHIDAVSGSISSAAQQIEMGNLIPIAVTSYDRDPFYPDVPTFMELGYDVAIDNQISIGAPKDTPPEIVEFIHTAIKDTLEDPSYQKLAEKLNLTIDYLGPEALMQSVLTSINSVKRVIEAME